MKIEKKHWILLAITGVVFIVWYLTKSKKGSAKLGTNGIAPIAYTPGSENQTLLDRLKNIKLQQKLSGSVSSNSYVKDGAESSFNKDITCKKCDWSWNKEDSQAHDLYTCHKCGYDNTNNESSFGKWKPDVVSPASQLKSVMNIDPLNNSVFATPLKHESSFRGGGGHHGGGGHGRHHGGRGGFGRWGGYGFGYPVYDTIGFGIPYDYYNEPVVINAAKCPEGFVYRGQKDGCKSINELVK
jgi:hypothetical protein